MTTDTTKVGVAIQGVSNKSKAKAKQKQSRWNWNNGGASISRGCQDSEHHYPWLAVEYSGEATRCTRGQSPRRCLLQAPADQQSKRRKDHNTRIHSSLHCNGI